MLGRRAILGALVLLAVSTSFLAPAKSPFQEWMRVRSDVEDVQGRYHRALVAVRPITLLVDEEEGSPTNAGDLLDCEIQGRAEGMVESGTGRQVRLTQTLLICRHPDRVFVVRGFAFNN